MPKETKEKWIDIQGWDVKDTLIFADFKPTQSLAVDPNNPNVGTPGLDDLTCLPAVQADVDGRDFLVWQRGNAPNDDADTLDLM